MANRGCLQLLAALLMMWQWCGMWVAAKQLVSGGFGVSRVVGTCSWGVLRACVGCFMVSKLWAMDRSGAEQVFLPLLMDMLTMMWQLCCVEWGTGVWTGRYRGVEEVAWLIVEGCWAGHIVSSSKHCVSASTVAHRCVIQAAGLWTCSVHCLGLGEWSLRWWPSSGC